jgi:hypothetical protein
MKAYRGAKAIDVRAGWTFYAHVTLVHAFSLLCKQTEAYKVTFIPFMFMCLSFPVSSDIMALNIHAF